jgi:hypothetical protein
MRRRLILPNDPGSAPPPNGIGRPLVLAALVAALSGGAFFFFSGPNQIVPVTYAADETSAMPEPIDQGALEAEARIEGDLPENAILQWTFDARAGQVVTGMLTTSAGGMIDILPPDGLFSLTEAATPAEGGTAIICNQPVDADGTYILRLHGTPTAGTYSLSFGVSDTPAGC